MCTVEVCCVSKKKSIKIQPDALFDTQIAGKGNLIMCTLCVEGSVMAIVNYVMSGRNVLGVGKSVHVGL